MKRESQSDGISTRVELPVTLTACSGFMGCGTNTAPSELGMVWAALPGVSFAMRTSPQAENCHRIRDSNAHRKVYYRSISRWVLASVFQLLDIRREPGLAPIG